MGNIFKGKETEPATASFVPLDVINRFKEGHVFPGLTEKQREVLYRAVEAFVTEDMYRRIGRSLAGDRDIECFQEGTGIVDTFEALGLISEQEKFEITELSPSWRIINSSIKAAKKTS